MLVGEDTSSESGSVVTTETDKHGSESWGLELGLKGVFSLLEVWDEDTVGLSHGASLGNVGGNNIFLGVLSKRTNNFKIGCHCLSEGER